MKLLISKHTVFCYLLLLIGYSNLCAQTPLKFKQLSVEEGIKNSRVVALTQDKEGFMWFATHDGVEKFNGTDFKHYSLSFKNETINIADDIVNCMELSNTYDILCGTKKGNLYSYNRKKDTFEKVLSNESSVRLYNINSILSVNDEEIWLGATSGFFHFNIKSNTLTQLGTISSRVNCITNLSKQYLLIGTAEGLFKVDKVSKEISIPAVENVHHLQENDIMSITKVNEQLLLGTRHSELFKFQINGDSLQLLNHKLIANAENSKPIYDIALSPDKNHYAVALDGLGLIITDTNLNQKDAYYAGYDDHDLSSNGIYQIHYSNDNVLWLATYGGGINVADPNKKKFVSSRRIPFNTNSLRNNTVNSILEIDKNIWFGTKEGISIYNTDTYKWKHLPALSKTMNRPFQVMDMSVSADGNVWIATYGRGLIKINSKTYKRELVNKQSKGWKSTQSNHLYKVIVDEEGKVWSGGIWGGISVIDHQKQSTHVVNITNIRSLYEVDDNIYVGTLFGLFIVNKYNFEVSRPVQSLLTDSRIISMIKHPSKAQLYIGTDINGLHILDLQNDSLLSLNSNNQLPTNYIRSIAFDNSQQLWVSTTGGISFYNDSTQLFESYNMSDGLASTEFSENAVLKHSSGRLIYGGSRGISSFYPKEITKSTQVVKPIFTSFEIFGERINISDDGPLKENFNQQTSIRLPHNQNSLSFGYGSICYTNPQNVRYKWILEGLEDKWHGPSVTREAIYPKLPPGNYTFKVMVSNDDGVWQEHVKSVDLIIDDPFWKTPIAYLIYAIILVILVLLNMHYYYTIVQDRHYQEKQQFFISIAHDLRTPLSLIKLPVEKLVEEGVKSESETRNLNLVKRNVDRLTNLVNQLLDFQKADLQKMLLQVEVTDINQFINERIESFTPLAIEKQINVTSNLSDDHTELWIDRSKMEKVMFNLLSNAFKYTPTGGAIEVSTQLTNKYLVIDVKDTGEGIPTKQQKNIFQRYYRATNAINSKEVGSGVGLMLTKQLVELHQGKISFKSEYGKGSVFSVSLPMGDSHFSDEDIRQLDNEESTLTPIFTDSQEAPKDNVDGPTLLLVEDNPELLDSLEIEFSGQYKVLKACDGQEGVKIAQEQLPDIIVSDVMMPNMNGHQLCMKLKAELSTCHIPIILLTALDSPEYKREGLEHGADAYLEKPFDIKLLRVQLTNLLKNRQLLKQKFLEPSTQVEEASSNSTDHEFLESIKSYIIDNIDSEKLTVENTARELGMSRPVLYRKIKALTDLSPQQFLMTVKLKEAARIMKEEGRNISETAYMIGFTDPKYFSQTFKKYFGVTPSNYLKDR